MPVKAAVQYSDALSTVPYRDAVGESFHHRGDETGTLWDAESKKNTDNLFTRHFIRPGTFLVQILTTNGRQLPTIGFDHLLLSLGLAGSYGGQTSVTGVNVRTHIAGISAARLEAPITSPYELLRKLPDASSVTELASAIKGTMSGHYRVAADANEASAYQCQLVDAFERDNDVLREQYKEKTPKIADLFEQHFTPRRA